MKRTAAQEAVIAHQDGPCLVVAGPGSGKTACITARIARLLREGAEGVVAVTFTRAAAAEMRERVRSQLPEAEADALLARATIGTLHSWCYQFLLRSGYLKRIEGTGRTAATSPRILSEAESLALLQEVLADRTLNLVREADEETVAEIASDLARLKGRYADDRSAVGRFMPESCTPERFWRIKEALSQRKRELNALDQDDLVRWALKVLRKVPHLRAAEQEKIHYLIVDESQDLSVVQADLITLLAGERCNVMWVGDDDQSIYSWRGAEPSIMLQFSELFPGSIRLDLTVNFRSTAAIVEAASRLVVHNRHRYEKALRASRPGGEPPRVVRPPDPAAEAALVVEWLRAHPPRERAARAVLYRSSMTALPLMKALDEAGIPYRVLGGRPGLLQRWMVRDCLGWIRWALGRATLAEAHQLLRRPFPPGLESWWTVLKPLCREPDDLLPQMRFLGLSFAAAKVERDLAKLRELPARQAITYIRKEIGYDSFVTQECQRLGMHVEDAFEALDVLADLGGDRPAAVLLELAESDSDRDGKETEPTPAEAVTLSTFHSSKGLEFDGVWILAAAERLVPSFRALRVGSHQRQAEVLEEERRLLYVAMTRARHELILSVPERIGSRRAKPSRFLHEAGLLP